MLECSFKFLDKSHAEAALPELYDILHANMSVIAPTGNSYQEDRTTWLSGILPALDQANRQIILIEVKGKLAGYFQYCVIKSIFMMEEIQFKEEYQGSGLFRQLYGHLVTIIPPDTKSVEANANKQNEKSQAILKHLGLGITSENKNGKSWHFMGDYPALIRRYGSVSDAGFRPRLDEALARYGFRDGDAELIRHNENMTYRVGSQYLLRIHQHRPGFTTDAIYEALDRAQLYTSELALISHLKACGLNVQTPVPNLNRELVTRLSDGTPATVLTWLEGHTIDKSELLPPLCHQIGAMTAEMHQATRHFRSVPALRYDDALCARLKSKLCQLSDAGVLGKESGEIMAAALDTVIGLLRQTKAEYILVHADLSLSNMLITDAGLAPIDFSLFGYGHPMMDLSGLYCCISGSVNRRAIAAGYAAAGGTIDAAAVECTFALNVLLGIILHSESWTKEAWFDEKLSGWCKNIFMPLTEGRTVVDTTVRAVIATEKDIPAWLALVNIVADDFPGLVIDEYTEILKKNIARQTALCVREDGKLAGILLFSPHRHCLSCMSVHPAYRQHGIASALIAEMLRLMPEGDIVVTTFREGDAKGTAPRALYQKFGFEPDELLTEFDYPVQRFVLRRPDRL